MFEHAQGDLFARVTMLFNLGMEISVAVNSQMDLVLFGVRRIHPMVGDVLEILPALETVHALGEVGT